MKESSEVIHYKGIIIAVQYWTCVILTILSYV